MTTGTGQILLDFDGVSVPFKITMNGVCQYTEETGEDFMQVVEGMGEKVNPVGFRRLFVVGLPKDPDPTLDRAGDIITALGFVPAVEVFTNAVSLFAGVGPDEVPDDEATVVGNATAGKPAKGSAKAT